jgi:hypothetical protein
MVYLKLPVNHTRVATLYTLCTAAACVLKVFKKIFKQKECAIRCRSQMYVVCHCHAARTLPRA